MSSTDLAFFEFLGEGSTDAMNRCKTCGFHVDAHERARDLIENPHLAKIAGHDFEPKGGSEFDRFYCGCRGWD